MNGQQQQQQQVKPPGPPQAQKPKGQKRQRNPRKGSQSQSPGVLAISIPASQGTVRRVKDPEFSQGGRKGDIIVSHTEYISDVLGSVAFTATQATVNPGLQGTFPWLASIAPNYESYKFESLEFEFRTTTNNQATGNVALLIDYDPADPAPLDKRAVLNSESSVDGPVWALCIKHQSKKENLNKRSTYLVRQGSVNATASLTLYDVGNLFVCTQGQASGAVIGELFCRYRVRLMTPQMGITGVGNALYSKLSATAAGGAITVTGNGPFTVTGTPAVATITATGPIQCIVAANVTGTGLVSLNGTGTVTQTPEGDIINSTATGLAANFIANFNAGDTLILTLTSTTATAYSVRIGQYLYSLA